MIAQGKVAAATAALGPGNKTIPSPERAQQIPSRSVQRQLLRPFRQRREVFIVEQLSQLFRVLTLAKRARNNPGAPGLFYTDKPANCGKNILHGVAQRGVTHRPLNTCVKQPGLPALWAGLPTRSSRRAGNRRSPSHSFQSDLRPPAISWRPAVGAVWRFRHSKMRRGVGGSPLHSDGRPPHNSNRSK